LHFFILGALEIRSANGKIPITAPKQRAVLAALLLNANTEVSVDRLADYVWEGRPPIAAQATLQSYIYRLRQPLTPIKGAHLRTSGASYTLYVENDDIDLGYFKRQLRDARALGRDGDLSGSVLGFRKALSVWRGNALSGVPGKFIQQEARFLESERLAAYEELFSAEITLGNHRRVIPEMLKLVATHPLHESLRAQLMLSMYRSGRQAEALHNFALMRRKLHDELGIEPGPDLQALRKAILERVPAARIALPS
jgi:DNA-binding SARP family transcriptional activator